MRMAPLADVSEDIECFARSFCDLDDDALLSMSVHMRREDLPALTATCRKMQAVLRDVLLEFAQQEVADLRPTLEFRLRHRVPPLGMTFERPQRLTCSLVSEAKSFGTRYAGCQLAFGPDGTVVGKFLKLITFRKPYGEAPEGDRSCWRGLYMVFPGGAVIVFECADCDANAISFENTDFGDAWLQEVARVELPLSMCTPEDRDREDWSAAPPKRWLVGDGVEADRLEAVELMQRLHGEQEFCTLSGELRPKYLARLLSWPQRAAWECPACDARNENLRGLACSTCGRPRLPAGSWSAACAS